MASKRPRPRFELIVWYPARSSRQPHFAPYVPGCHRDEGGRDVPGNRPPTVAPYRLLIRPVNTVAAPPRVKRMTYSYHRPSRKDEFEKRNEEVPKSLVGCESTELLSYRLWRSAQSS